MAQGQGTIVFNNFVKGLITDSSDFNSDPTSMKDGVNFQLTRKGTLEKRLGLAVDYSVANLKGMVGDNPKFKRMTTFDGKKWLVVSGTNASGDEQVVILDEVNFSTKAIFSYQSLFDIDVSCSDRFILATLKLNEVKLITYNDEGNFISSDVEVKLRDFEGVDDDLLNDVRPSGVSLSTEHQYNLENQGWGNTFPYTEKYIETFTDEGGGTTSQLSERVVTNLDYVSFKNSIGSYPSNADIAHLGIYLDPNDGGKKKFKPENIVNTYLGNARAPMGKKVLSVRDIYPRKLNDGTVLTGTPYPFAKGKACSTFFAGRAFYGSDNVVYFSQTIGRDARKLGLCYQENDPTSEEMSDLLDTDGGAVVISGASGIFHLTEIGRSLVVFANNGIWAISGGESSFKATEYSVYKISDYTSLNSTVIYNIPNAVTFVSQSGIMLMSTDQVTMSPSVNNITLNSVQELFSSFSGDDLSKTKISFEAKKAKVNYLIGNTLLILDTTLQAWYKHKLPTGAVALYHTDEEQVITEQSTITHLGIDVTNDSEVVALSTNSVVSVVPQVMVTYGANNGSYKFCTFSDTDYIDFKGTVDESDYESYFITQPLTFDNAVSKKRLKQLSCFFTKTETGYSENEEGGLEYVRPSSCKLQIGWDMPTSNSYASDPRNMWSREYELYRLSRYESKSLGEVPANALESLMTRTSVRGTGRTISMRFSSPSGYDCRLLGWSVDMLANTRNK